MVSVKDGMKIGLGFLLFKWLMGMASCTAALGIITCVALSNRDDVIEQRKQKAQIERKRKETKKTFSTEGTVQFNTQCNIREEPTTESDKIGTAKSSTSYTVLDRKGYQWYKIKLNNSTSGWAGCKTKSDDNGW